MISGLIGWIIVGAIGGWLAGYALKRDTSFDLADVILGMVGAIVGGWLVSVLYQPLAEGGLIASIIVAFIGAVIVAWVYEKVTGRSAQ